jgi:hypothetical protein
MSDIYQDWLHASSKLKECKAEELLLRNAICSTHHTEALEGSRTMHSGEYKLTITNKLTRTIDREVLEAIYDSLTDQEKECIDYKPALKMREYKVLEQTGGRLLEAVTVKPAQSSLKIIQEVYDE